MTLQTSDLSPSVYWRSPFDSLADVSQLVEFIVLDVDPTGQTKGKWVLADITVARASDLGSNDQVYYVRSHLGAICHPGDSVMGYFIANSNYNSDLFDALNMEHVPDVVLVKKQYIRKTRKNRSWKLKRMAREHKDIEASQDYSSRQQKQEMERAEKDYELFLQELEEDAEMRQAVNLYKSAQQAPQDGEMDEDEEEDAPQIDIDELLDELDEMTLDEGAPPA